VASSNGRGAMIVCAAGRSSFLEVFHSIEVPFDRLQSEPNFRTIFAPFLQQFDPSFTDTQPYYRRDFALPLQV
jgi:hypothetical protein